VPLRLIAAVPLVEELLLTESRPVAVPTAVGANSMFIVATCPGFNVVGKLATEREKPLPVRLAELIITGAVPVDARATDCVAAVFTSTSPNGMLVALMLSLGTAAFNCSA
jgi:hypothetical protein